MKKISVMTLVGGLSDHSLNRKLYESLSPMDHDLDFKCAQIEKLPYFNQDLEMDPPQVVVQFKEQIKESDAVLFVTPEYNRSIPGVLKNAIDWGSRPMGNNCWSNMPAAIMGVSRSKLGTFSAQVHLRIILSFLHMKVMSQPEYCLTADSNILTSKEYFLEGKLKDKADYFLSSFKEWIEFLNEKNTNFAKVKLSLFSYSQEV
jgi:chromate reductase